MSNVPAEPNVGPLRICFSFPGNVPPDAGGRAIFLIGRKWPMRDLRVRFLGGDATLRASVLEAARRWERFANVQFLESPDDDAEIRIAFEAGGSWSYVGTECRSIDPGRCTMNFGWIHATSDAIQLRRVVLHEFGHALGLIHEHQHPEGGIPWNKARVYAVHAGPPHFWSRAEVDSNFFDTYSREQTQFTKLDPTSIMMYPIDPRLTDGKLAVAENDDLSDTDKAFIGQMYP